MFLLPPSVKAPLSLSLSLSALEEARGKRRWGHHGGDVDVVVVIFFSRHRVFHPKETREEGATRGALFPSSMSSSSNDASLDDVNDFGGGNDDDDDGRGRRFVDVACKGNFCFPEEGASKTDDDDADASKTDDDVVVVVFDVFSRLA